MSEKMRESLSALMDGEANELEVERVLAHAAGDEELRTAWVRYNAARDALSGGVAPAHLDMDISRQVAAAVSGQGTPLGTAVTTLRQRIARPLTSFAVAASVATAVVLGGQQFEELNNAGEVPPQLPVIAVAQTPASFGSGVGVVQQAARREVRPVTELSPITPSGYSHIAKYRMGRYLQEHTEHAALNTPQGMITFARVPRLEE